MPINVAGDVQLEEFLHCGAQATDQPFALASRRASRHYALVRHGPEDEERELRQFTLMAERLDGFVAGTVPLKRLIDDLYGLVAALDLTPEEWRDEFISEWGDLEIAYAVADDRREPVPTMADSDVADAVRTLRAMVGVKLGS